MSRNIISLGEFRSNGGGCWIEVPRHSVPVSVRKDGLPTDLKLSASSGVLLHTVPACWSAFPLLALCQASFFFSHANARWSPRTWSPASRNPSEHPNFPSSLYCVHIYTPDPDPFTWPLELAFFCRWNWGSGDAFRMLLVVREGEERRAWGCCLSQNTGIVCWSDHRHQPVS